jgi:hypothetical protein
MRGEDELLKIEVFCKIRNLYPPVAMISGLLATSTVALQEIERAASGP